MVDRFLSETYAYAEELAPGLGPQLVVLHVEDMNNPNLAQALETPTPAGSAPNLPPSPFIGTTDAAEVSRRLGSPANTFFVVMDSRSAEDDTVVLAHTDEGNGSDVQTVRATFKSAQIVLVALDVGSQGFEEVQIIAADSPDGVYGPERDE